MIDLVQPSHVFLDCAAKDVNEALHFISRKAVELGAGADEETIFKAFRAREDMGSTAMTDGFAIPHAQIPELNEAMVIIVKFSSSLAWKSMDGKPITYAIALLTPGKNEASAHLEMLAKIARVLTHVNFRSEMASANSAEQIADAVNKRLHN
ncbi:MAG: PTS sugar transporter subunit IIA [Atopobium sp.]|jgi:PTS system fructose-specific IIA component|nr:PTS sugar transporter subunit IIA [Atopobium sp.]